MKQFLILFLCYLDESVAQRSAVVYRHGYWCGLPGTVSVWGPGSD